MIASRRKQIIIFAVTLAVLSAFIIWVAWSNTALLQSEYCIESDGLSKAFEGFRIAQVSDLHNASMGDNNEKLIEMLKSAKPDIIAITGDLVDSKNTDIEVALDFAKEAVRIAPCYYVTGNHEAGIPCLQELLDGLSELGVTYLDNDKLKIEKDTEYITLIGLQDPAFSSDPMFDDDESIAASSLEYLMEDVEGYSVLLSHRPELFGVYKDFGIDLVLCGHAHGGQFRLPIIGGLVAPGQGLFPKYDAGLYSENGTVMVVSRGIGNSIIPIRFNNRPELVLTELRDRS